MYLIEAEGKQVMHTGDFRLHGFRGKATPKLIRWYAKDVDVLIIEGTQLSKLIIQDSVRPLPQNFSGTTKTAPLHLFHAKSAVFPAYCMLNSAVITPAASLFPIQALVLRSGRNTLKFPPQIIW